MIEYQTLYIRLTDGGRPVNENQVGVAGCIKSFAFLTSETTVAGTAAPVAPCRKMPARKDLPDFADPLDIYEEDHCRSRIKMIRKATMNFTGRWREAPAVTGKS
jgi:hypothetical protein